MQYNAPHTYASFSGRVLMLLLKKPLDQVQILAQLMKRSRINHAQVRAIISALSHDHLIVPVACTTKEGFKKFANDLHKRIMRGNIGERPEPTPYTLTNHGYTAALLISLEELSLTHTDTSFSRKISKVRKSHMANMARRAHYHDCKIDIIRNTVAKR